MIDVYVHDFADVKLSPEQAELIKKCDDSSPYLPTGAEIRLHSQLMRDIDRVARWKADNAKLTRHARCGRMAFLR